MVRPVAQQIHDKLWEAYKNILYVELEIGLWLDISAGPAEEQVTGTLNIVTDKIKEEVEDVIKELRWCLW